MLKGAFPYLFSMFELLFIGQHVIKQFFELMGILHSHISLIFMAFWIYDFPLKMQQSLNYSFWSLHRNMIQVKACHRVYKLSNPIVSLSFLEVLI